MKAALLAQAREHGHTMILIAPGRYECRDCNASIKEDQTGCNNNWQASKTLLQCPGAQNVPIPNSTPDIPKRIA